MTERTNPMSDQTESYADDRRKAHVRLYGGPLDGLTVAMTDSTRMLGRWPIPPCAVFAGAYAATPLGSARWRWQPEEIES